MIINIILIKLSFIKNTIFHCSLFFFSTYMRHCRRFLYSGRMDFTHQILDMPAFYSLSKHCRFTVHGFPTSIASATDVRRCSFFYYQNRAEFKSQFYETSSCDKFPCAWKNRVDGVTLNHKRERNGCGHIITPLIYFTERNETAIIIKFDYVTTSCSISSCSLSFLLLIQTGMCNAFQAKGVSECRRRLRADSQVVRLLNEIRHAML